MTEETPGAIPESAPVAPMQPTQPVDAGGYDGGGSQPAPDDSANWQKRFSDTQSAFTKSQQELSETRKQMQTMEGRLQEITPYYEQQKKFFNPETTQPKSAWDYENGIDGAIAERDTQINDLNQNLKQMKEAYTETRVWQLQQQFSQDQNRLYNELGANEFGSQADFAEAIKQLPTYDPNWENSYLQKPGYETLRNSYRTMRGALALDPNSPLSRQIEAKKQQAFLQKQSNYLGGGQSIKFGPSETNPNSAYMTPIESV